MSVGENEVQFDYSKYNQDQCEEIRKHRWIESEKAGYDLGKSAELDWVSKWAKSYRENAIRTGKYNKIIKKTCA